jgi:hypothetical protein
MHNHWATTRIVLASYCYMKELYFTFTPGQGVRKQPGQNILRRKAVTEVLQYIVGLPRSRFVVVGTCALFVGICAEVVDI